MSLNVCVSERWLSCELDQGWTLRCPQRWSIHALHSSEELGSRTSFDGKDPFYVSMPKQRELGRSVYR